jgi:hypothetical protein
MERHCYDVRFDVFTAVRVMVMMIFCGLWRCVDFSSEDGDSMFFRYVGTFRGIYKAPKPRITSSLL